ncbi:threonine aldolase family protein [Peribacillus simplex]|uniref:threonine aldolase family protein n=1 Tax=Peribacillus simplex TaxID=1478 RepID=UPI003D2698DA
MIELRSDTFTLPSEEMMDSIKKAVLGDDVYGLDPTVNELEKKSAELLGKADAVLFPSGTMANLASIMAHCPRGTKVLVGDKSDIYIYEAGGATVCGGIIYDPIPTEKNGTLKIKNIETRFPKDPTDPQFALPSLLCIENPSNRTGGRVLPLAYLQELNHYTRMKNIPIHMDGARIFNASVALDISPIEIAMFADSVQFCLSKGLSAPIGSIVAGSSPFIKKVRMIRKMLGGGMRQAGIIAAPGIVALENRNDVLKKDHIKATNLAEKLSLIKEIDVSPNVETNMVFFTLKKEFLIATFISTCEMYGLNIDELEPGVIRAVLHSNVSNEDVEKAAEIIKKAIPFSKREFT